MGKRKLNGIHIDKCSENNFSDCIRMNVYKLNHIFRKAWDKLTYKEYLELSETVKIASYEREFVKKEEKIDVLNTSVFMILDYFGNKNGFFDSIIMV